MSARILVVASVKGGVGKTTLSAAAAATLARRGYNVLAIDADRQGTLAQWGAMAPPDVPFPATVMHVADAGAKLRQRIAPEVANYDFVVIDCPPSMEQASTHSALLVADACVIPSQATPADLWATTTMGQLVHRAKQVNRDLRAFTVINRWTPRRSLARQIVEVMQEEGGLALLDPKLGNRVSFQDAAVQGSVPAAMVPPTERLQARSTRCWTSYSCGWSGSDGAGH